MIEQFKTSAAFIQSKTTLRPEVAVILGSGLGELAEEIKIDVVIPYPEIPGFRVSTAIGHKGNLIFGYLANRPVMAMQGRFHFYEGYSMQQVTYPVRVMHFLGIKTLFVSNAAGGLNPAYHVGDLMVITDHINQMPNPLIGPNFNELGPRFPDMTQPYDAGLIAMADSVAVTHQIPLHKGVYLGSSGPTFETPSEYRFFRNSGGDVCGMSTIPEVIVARHMNLRVFGMSVVTNEAHTFDDGYKNDGEDVIVAANKAAKKMKIIFEGMLSRL
ncbi:MAG: purine-nucleoside phosphorylase [Bacteroidales bacterium]|nr:purine-nucleoside phosphorylase [Bacteroidales bacterium]MDD2323415.1 purine-nucleoside phosphorylase [Bacteroidales bacterium]MDD3962303.1 purine-nucleoside phosphorylase [Bacteroidales bacterium]MDY0286173.1 purine-nucleoside phosphorylase [Bacteroidales bacterium]HPE87786.1 purine-nucleoside phosphorylase [Bacteroidales bacterium]